MLLFDKLSCKELMDNRHGILTKSKQYYIFLRERADKQTTNDWTKRERERETVNKTCNHDSCLSELLIDPWTYHSWY